MSKIQKVCNRTIHPLWSHVIRRSILSWLIGALVEYILLVRGGMELFDKESFGLMSPVRVAITICGFFCILMVLGRKYKTEAWERWGIALVCSALCIVGIRSSGEGAFLGVCILCIGILVIYGAKGWDYSMECISPGEKTKKHTLWILTLLALLFLGFVSLWTVARVYSFKTPTYDFGIFSQMFYYMKETGLPLTTLERDGLLSHFAVHVSPIYYLLLPVYALVPHPATLQILQGVVITSAVIPLWLLGKHYGFNGVQGIFLCGILFLLPSFSGGVGYDIHENCFLTPLILWLFYGIEKKKMGFTILFAFLVLCVKEDGAVYVAVIGLWLFVRSLLSQGLRKERSMALCVLVLSLVWFYGVTTYLNRWGDGVMSGRYENFMNEERGSLLRVVCNALLHPMKILYECSEREKLRYLALTMAPLLGLPLITRRYERYILLIPYILVNLMSDYTYQHEIFFQYSFGTTGFLMYLLLINLSDMKNRKGITAVLSASVLLCGVCFALVVVPKGVTYPSIWIEEKEISREIRQALTTVPEEATVTATTFYTTELSQRRYLYDIAYTSPEQVLESEYVVLDPRYEHVCKKYRSPGKTNGLENLIAILKREGYEEVISIEGTLWIFKK